LLVGDIVGVREAFLATLDALRRRELPTFDVSSKVRLTKTPEQYSATRESRRELTYEAMLGADGTRGMRGTRFVSTGARAGWEA
jgi:DNA polymerase, archaea type